MIKKHFLNRNLNSNSVLVPLGSSPVIALCFILLFCFIFVIPVKADSPEPKYLPYDYTWNYYALSDGEINTMLNMASSYIDITSDNLIIYWYEIGNDSWLYEFCVAIVDDVQYPNGKNYDNVNLTSESVTLYFSSSYIGFTDFHNINEHANQSYAPTSRNFFGSNSQLVQTSDLITYKGMPLYGTVELNGKLIIGVPQGQVVGSVVAPFGADASQSDFLGTGADFGASISQATMPTAPTYNTYNFTTFNPPSFDDSSVLDALQSIADILQYLASYLSQNITGAINNLGDNIQALGQYIGDLLQYIARSIITNIQYGIQNLFENLQSLFAPLLNSINEIIDSINQKLDYISQPYDANAVSMAFENTSVKNDIDSISQFCSTAFGLFDGISEPSDFKIPLHLENIAILNISQVQYIDLGCINSVKTAIRAIMWCLTTFSLLYTIIDAIPSYISGGDE